MTLYENITEYTQSLSERWNKLYIPLNFQMSVSMLYLPTGCTFMYIVSFLYMERPQVCLASRQSQQSSDSRYISAFCL